MNKGTANLWVQINRARPSACPLTDPKRWEDQNMKNSEPNRKTEILLFTLLMATLIPLELLCACLAYETLGEISSGIYFFGVGFFNLIFIIIAIRSRMWAAIGAILFGLAIVPYQGLLTHRLLLLKDETARIVSYIYETKKETGEYPLDLSQFRFNHPHIRKYIQSYEIGDQYGGFMLTYRVGTESTSHWYSPKDDWSYYPD